MIWIILVWIHEDIGHIHYFYLVEVLLLHLLLDWSLHLYCQYLINVVIMNIIKRFNKNDHFLFWFLFCVVFFFFLHLDFVSCLFFFFLFFFLMVESGLQQNWHVKNTTQNLGKAENIKSTLTRDSSFLFYIVYFIEWDDNDKDCVVFPNEIHNCLYQFKRLGFWFCFLFLPIVCVTIFLIGSLNRN